MGYSLRNSGFSKTSIPDHLFHLAAIHARTCVHALCFLRSNMPGQPTTLPLSWRLAVTPPGLDGASAGASSLNAPRLSARQALTAFQGQAEQQSAHFLQELLTVDKEVLLLCEATDSSRPSGGLLWR